MVEHIVLLCALQKLKIALLVVLGKIRRGEAIPFEEVSYAATGKLRTQLINEAYGRYGQSRGMRQPLEIQWLRPWVKDLLGRHLWTPKIERLLEKIARAVEHRPKAAPPPEPMPPATPSPEANIPAAEAPASLSSADPEASRRAVIEPILAEKGWSVLDWAKAADVDYHTANDYLSGATNPYKSTRAKLAKPLQLTVDRKDPRAQQFPD